MRIVKLSPPSSSLLCSMFWGPASKQINKAPNSTPTLPINWATLPWDGAIPEGKAAFTKDDTDFGRKYIWNSGNVALKKSASLFLWNEKKKNKTQHGPFPQIPPREDEANFPASQ